MRRGEKEPNYYLIAYIKVYTEVDNRHRKVKTVKLPV